MIHYATLSLAALLALTGCSTMPVSGPHSSLVKHAQDQTIRVRADATKPEHDYTLIDVNPALFDALRQTHLDEQSLQARDWPRYEKRQDLYVNIDDVLQITIYEADSGGLFIPAEAGVRPGNFVQLPPQVVDTSGEINVPYAGRLTVAGHSITHIETVIAARLRNKAIEPQVVVSFNQRASSQISVIGAVNDSQRYSLTFNGDKILDAIANAGGPSFEGYETTVALQRNYKEYRIRFNELMRDAGKNIYLKPNDTLYLNRDPETFNALGAVSFAGTYRFEKPDLYLSEAIGRAGGLNDNRADAAEVYVYRMEHAALLEHLGGNNRIAQEIEPEDTSPLSTSIAEMSQSQRDILGITLEGSVAVELDEISDVYAPPPVKGLVKAPVPTIYKFNLRKADGFFLTQQFKMRDDDVLYVANSESVELLKFINIINPSAITTINTRAAGD